MLLRLYQSPRSTQDVDFVLVTNESRKIWKEKITEDLEREGILVEHVEMNSRGIFFDIQDESKTQKAQIEISIKSSTDLKPEAISTAMLSSKYHLSGRIISSMAISEAFSHKIAASLERDATRDFFDLSQFEDLGTFDVSTLRNRLSKLVIGKAKPRSVSFQEAAEMLRKKLEVLDQKKIEKDLYPLLPIEYRAGILGTIRASVSRTIRKIEPLS
ncbi:MAG: nucleotidyl transferase AbiEii/AbiGii toxin family protein [Deltaproteobacteria bacterium]|nr:nucleotidyl transferase AbiEii/AbiGii toxin family protein [Deltaproteobacteria bacterium]